MNRLDETEFGWIVSWEVKMSKVRKVWCKKGVRMVWVHPSYVLNCTQSINQSTVLRQSHYFHQSVYSVPIRTCSSNVYDGFAKRTGFWFFLVFNFWHFLTKSNIFFNIQSAQKRRFCISSWPISDCGADYLSKFNMMESDDEIPTLPSDTLKALQEFYAERSAASESLPSENWVRLILRQPSPLSSFVTMPVYEMQQMWRLFRFVFFRSN